MCDEYSSAYRLRIEGRDPAAATHPIRYLRQRFTVFSDCRLVGHPALSQIREIIIQGKHHDAQHQNNAHLVARHLNPLGKRLAQQRLKTKENQLPAIQHGNWEQIQHAE